MVEITKLKEEDLEKVNGGTSGLFSFVIVDYLDYEGGEPQTHNLGEVSPCEQCARDWCIENNKIYQGYHMDSGKTNVYDAKDLIATLSKK